MLLSGRDKEITARGLLLHLDKIKTVFHQKRWGELIAVVEYAKKDVPVDMSKTDPAMYRMLRAAITEFNLRGYDRFNLEKLYALAEKDAGSQNKLSNE